MIALFLKEQNILPIEIEKIIKDDSDNTNSKFYKLFDNNFKSV